MMSNKHKDADNILLERKYSITREIYNVDKFLQHYPKSSEKHKIFSPYKFLKSCTCSKFANLLSFIFPFYSVLVRFYNLRSFVLDCIAGLTLSIVHIPQGMAYGVLAGVKPINGLYTSFFPALVYFFFGTSRHVSIGTFSVVSLLTADPVDRLISTLDVNNRSLEKYQVFNENQQIDDFRLQIVVTVCILAGLFQLVLGIIRLDVLVVYISEPLLGGFTCASAIHVFTSQLNGLFGIKLNRATGPFRIFYIIKNFIYIVKETNVTTLLISLICIFIMSCFKHYINPKVSTKIRFTIPIELIILVIGTVFSRCYLLNQRYGVSIVGEIPEFRALGLCNVISGFFRCQPASGALARTSVAYGVGMCSQIASLISCCILLLVITVIGQFLQTVPMCILSSIIVVSLESIFLQITDVRVFYHSSLYDMLIWLVTFLATALIDVPLGLLIGLCFSLLTVLYRTQSTYYYELGQIPNTNIYVDLAKYDEAVKLPKIIILKYGGPLYYANAESFQNWINRLTDIDPHKVIRYRQHIKQRKEQYQRRQQRQLNSDSHNRQHHKVGNQPSFVKNLIKHVKPKKKECEKFPNDLELMTDAKDCDPTDHLKFIIIDISSWIYLDVVGMRTVTDLVRSYSELDIRILFTVCDPQIQSVLTSGSLTLSQFQKNSFMSIHDAVVYCQGILSTTTTTTTNLDITDHSTKENELHLPIKNIPITYLDSSALVEDIISDSSSSTKL
ncbi:hypothetical protein MN116_005492 [Schistosoma mekongi]|uniref:STAS domain-containing protein n=1 Tax=Schistosoma mekongi TaxID=38744 RepID=A0AAE1ZC66_SCHME|nr:hypothetical protein MN116_005492 [Schistosoma mekongi]